MTTVSKPVTDLSDTRHVYTWEDMHLAITLERFAEERGGLKCEITVCDTESGQKLIPTGNFNLSSAIGRKNTTNRLKARTPDESLDWDLYLDYVTDISQSRYRTGDSVIELMSVPVAERPRFLLQPFIENDGVTLIYGDGGCGKSLLALAMAMSVASGVPILGMTPTRVVPVLYLDWESAANDHAERARAIHAGTGTDLDPPMFIHYQRQVASLAEGAPNISRVLQDLHIGLCVVDSVGMARGGAPEAADVTIAFFRAARSLGVPVVAIDHVSQEARKTKDFSSPFGSRFTHNLARRSWSVEKRSDESTPSEHTVLMALQKHNNTGASAAERIAYHFGFQTSTSAVREQHLDAITIRAQEWDDAVQETHAIDRMSKRDQVRYALREASDPLSVLDIRDWLISEGVTVGEQVIRNSLGRNPDLFVSDGGTGRTNRWKLREVSQ